MPKVTATEHSHALEMLIKFIKPGSTIYSVLRKSTATRKHVSFFVYHEGQMMLLDGYISKILPWDKLAKTPRGGLILDKQEKPAEVVRALQPIFGGEGHYVLRHEDL